MNDILIKLVIQRCCKKEHDFAFPKMLFLVLMLMSWNIHQAHKIEKTLALLRNSWELITKKVIRET